MGRWADWRYVQFVDSLSSIEYTYLEVRNPTYSRNTDADVDLTRHLLVHILILVRIVLQAANLCVTSQKGSGNHFLAQESSLALN
jgi:hypothetical protein